MFITTLFFNARFVASLLSISSDDRMKTNPHNTQVLESTTRAFTNHSLVKVKKSNGEVLGPGYIAIMYGDVAFRMYSKNVNEGSHFVRIEEIADLLLEHSDKWLEATPG